MVYLKSVKMICKYSLLKVKEHIYLQINEVFNIILEYLNQTKIKEGDILLSQR
jgi:hypothetical protein